MRDTLRTIIADDYLGDLTALDMDELRRRRATCREVETGLSYLRRQAQGRLDVVAAERSRRAEGGGADDDLEDLIARLPELLAGSTRSPGAGRLPSEFGTGSVDPDLADELDDILSRAGCPSRASSTTTSSPRSPSRSRPTSGGCPACAGRCSIASTPSRTS